MNLTDSEVHLLKEHAHDAKIKLAESINIGVDCEEYFCDLISILFLLKMSKKMKVKKSFVCCFVSYC